MYTLMIVDDSDVIRRRIERSCSDEYHIVAAASNGEDALAKFKEHKPDLITMDLTMPNMDGLACIQEICKIDESVGILVVSALTDKMTGLLALEYGAKGFIFKPFTDEQLNTALQKVALQKS